MTRWLLAVGVLATLVGLAVCFGVAFRVLMLVSCGCS
jgi:hypothetical protein